MRFKAQTKILLTQKNKPESDAPNNNDDDINNKPYL